MRTAQNILNCSSTGKGMKHFLSDIEIFRKAMTLNRIISCTILNELRYKEIFLNNFKYELPKILSYFHIQQKKKTYKKAYLYSSFFQNTSIRMYLSVSEKGYTKIHSYLPVQLKRNKKIRMYLSVPENRNTQIRMYLSVPKKGNTQIRSYCCFPKYRLISIRFILTN